LGGFSSRDLEFATQYIFPEGGFGLRDFRNEFARGVLGRSSEAFLGVRVAGQSTPKAHARALRNDQTTRGTN
jgi:hypothetical protein